MLAPSAVAAGGEIYTDAEGMKPHPTPQAMTGEDIRSTIAEYAQAAKNAVTARFDGIELHSANGYLLEQFIRPNTNQRTRCLWRSDKEPRAFCAGNGGGGGGCHWQGQGRNPAFFVRRVQRHALYDGMEADYTYLAQELERAAWFISTSWTTRPWALRRCPMP